MKKLSYALQHQIFHAIKLILYILLIPISVFTPLKSSIEFLVALSVMALVESAFTDWIESLEDPPKENP